MFSISFALALGLAHSGCHALQDGSFNMLRGLTTLWNMVFHNRPKRALIIKENTNAD